MEVYEAQQIRFFIPQKSDFIMLRLLKGKKVLTGRK